VITGNCNLKTFFDFSYYFVFTYIYLHFFSYSGEGFFILYKESKENRKVRNMCLVGNKDDSSIFLSRSPSACMLVNKCGHNLIAHVHKNVQTTLSKFIELAEINSISDYVIKE